jgi:protein ImuB
VPSGGRSFAEVVRLQPWGDERVPERPVEPPWPGRIPAPAPATVYPEPVPAEVCAADGSAVRVSGRLAVSAPPARVSIGGDGPVEVVRWAGPWPVDERWWAPAESYRAARFQLVLADGRAVLAALSRACWTVEAVYD